MSETSRGETFYKEVVLNATKEMFTVDQNGTIVFATEQIGELSGTDSESLGGLDLEVVFETLTLERIMDAINPSTESGTLQTTLQVDGNETSVSLYIETDDWDGKQFFTCTLDRRQSNHADKQSTTLLRQLLTQGSEPFFVFDVDNTTLVDYNNHACELLAITPEQLQTQTVQDFVTAPTVFKSFLDDVLNANEGRREEFIWQTAGDEERAVEIDALPIELDGERFVFARARDVSDRNKLQKQRRRRTAALDTVQEGVAVLDKSFEHTYVNEAYTDILGDNTDGSIDGEPLRRFLENKKQFEESIKPSLEQDGCWDGTINGIKNDGTITEIGAVLEQLEDGSIITVVREETEAERGTDSPKWTVDGRFNALNKRWHRLAEAGDVEAVANACLDTVRDVFGYDLACLRVVNDGELEPIAMTSATDEVISETPGFELGLSDAGRALRTGEPVVRTNETVSAVADLLSSSVHFPIGDEGVLSIAATDTGTFPPGRLESLSLLAVSVETALERIKTDQRPRDRWELDSNAEQSPESGPHTAVLTQEVFSELVDADSRADLEARICTTLAAADGYRGAWIGAIDATGERFRLCECAGIPREQLSHVTDTNITSVADGAIATAVETSEIVVRDSSVISDTDSHYDGTHFGDEICVVPLKHGEKVFGTLVIHFSDPNAPSPADERSLEVLGEGISFALSALENERLLVSDEFVELEFQVTDPDCLSVALSEELDTTVSMKRTVQNAKDEYLSYVRVQDTDPETAVETAVGIDSVRDCRVINDYEYGCLLEVTRPSSGTEVMMEFGATMRKAEAKSGRGTLVLEAPHSVDVRRIVDAYQSYNPQSELLSKRRIDRPVRATDQLRANVEDELTKKQLSAVSAAYFSGYYEWPRESTAEEVAESIGISASTLHQHLRRAQKKLLASILEGSFSRHL